MLTNWNVLHVTKEIQSQSGHLGLHYKLIHSLLLLLFDTDNMDLVGKMRDAFWDKLLFASRLDFYDAGSVSQLK